VAFAVAFDSAAVAAAGIDSANTMKSAIGMVGLAAGVIELGAVRPRSHCGAALPPLPSPVS
jgi:hypothetical protein